MIWSWSRKKWRMKALHSVLLTSTLAISSFAQDAKTNAVPDQSKTNQSVITLLASAAEVSAPMVFTNGYLAQPERTELPAGGKAVFSFAATNAGDYLIKVLVDGEGEDSNSFYVNVDAQPEDPMMIWDFDVTSGYQERTVSWRGNGTPESNEIVPKKFKLTVGAHKLIIIGREPAGLKTISICPVE